MDLIMDKTIVWDRGSLKQIDEAKMIILSYVRKGYTALLRDGSEMIRFNPNAEEVIIKAQKCVKKVMKILCDMGDDRIVWDCENGKEAMEAKERFTKLLDKGYKAYSIDHGGNKKSRIHEFDVDAEEIIMVPKTARG